MAKKKNPKDASKIFESIIKAAVSDKPKSPPKNKKEE